MGRARRLFFVVLLVDALLAGPLGAAVRVTALRTETLYAADAMPDCAKLSKLADDGLPLSIVRLRAEADGAPAEQTTFRWSASGPGLLVADLDIGPAGQSGPGAGLCAEFGDACVLTPEKLPFYTKSSILWVAPTCDILPKTPFKPFRGGVSRIAVQAVTGARKLGRASVKLGFGHTASITLFADGDDGVGNRGGIPSDINPQFGAVVNPNGVTLPAPNKFEFGTGEQTKKTVFDLQRCSATSTQGCTQDADCNPLFCQDCGQDETCLTQSHCSTTLARPCQHDSDCSQSSCPTCKEDETCVQV